MCYTSRCIATPFQSLCDLFPSLLCQWRNKLIHEVHRSNSRGIFGRLVQCYTCWCKVHLFHYIMCNARWFYGPINYNIVSFILFIVVKRGLFSSISVGTRSPYDFVLCVTSKSLIDGVFIHQRNLLRSPRRF